MTRKHTQRLWVWVFIVLAMGGVGQAGVLHTTLHNGLTVLIEEQPAHPVVSVQVLVRTGSIYEQEYLGSGMSHFFEHIIHGGTTSTRSSEETRVLLEAMGNNTNAYTTTDHTAYYINTTTAHWPTALDLLADWMFHSSIAPEDFEREKGVVQRELEQGLDSPAQMLTQLTAETRFHVHPVRYPVIGYKELVQQVSRDDLVTYYQRMYTPNNIIVVVVGDVRTQAVLERIRQTFGGGQRRPLPAISLPEEPMQLSKRTAVREMPISQAHMSLSFRTVPLTHPHLYPLDVLAYILANGDSTRLVQRIQEEQQLVYGIQTASHTPSYVPGSLLVWATLEPEQIEAAEEAILRELYRLREELVTPQELAKAKKQKIAEHIFARQTVQERANALGTDMLSAYDPTFSDTYVQHIQGVTAEDIRQVAQAYVREQTLVRAVVRPPLNSVPTATTSAPETAMPVIKKVLAHGLTVLIEHNPSLPVVAMQAYFKAGVRVETPETNGLSTLMAHVLAKGTTSLSAEDIATVFDAIGGSLHVESGNNSVFLTATCLKEDFATAFAVFVDVIRRPTFPEAEIEKARRQLLATIESHNDDWHAEVQRLFRETFFTLSPYRLSPEGSAAAVQRLQRQDILAFYQRYVVPGNIVLAIFGDVDVTAITTAVEQAFADFPARPVTFPQIPAEPMPAHTRRQIKQTQKQTAAIYIGFPGPALANVADRYPLQILDAIMSGMDFPGGWLHHELRGQQLVYAVHALSWLGLEAGYFGIYAATQPPQVDTVVEIILQKVAQAQAGQISDEEIAHAKQAALVTTRLNRQTHAQRAADAALSEIYGLGYDFSRHEPSRIAQVTRADVQRVARTYLQHPTIVITTPPPPR